ncbi:hypothetical protein [[Clostridium] dakarense]|uniref:hypothetical protein n=1 Tax=Faecalimicrobium dakarense TaxID=1301100 RepID=UPI0004BC85CE|nr:hypothetical protein [[Clostridium] dakarense]
MGIYEIGDKLGEKISLSKISSLKWDKGYAFKPGTPREKIYNTVGYKFYRITESDDVSQVVLMDGDKVVFYSGWGDNLKPYTMDFENVDFKDEVLTILPDKSDYFKIGRGEKNPITDRHAIKLTYLND